MATYNGERFLKEQLDSLARQTLLPFELVVCDDNSRDATLSILGDFQDKSPFPVRIVVNDTNMGHGHSFLRAAEIASGEFIAFCDQDDVWMNNKLEAVWEVFKQHRDLMMVSHSAIQVDENLNELPYVMPDYGRDFKIVESLNSPSLGSLPGFTCCVHRSAMRYVSMAKRPDDMVRPLYAQAHDAVLYHIADAFGRIAYMPDKLALYRRHGATVTGAPGTGMGTCLWPIKRGSIVSSIH
jgi:glycosyltransferase involved in cell wall biosynthesis